MMEKQVIIRGRTTKPFIRLPQEWEETVDPTSITVHLTESGAKQNVVVKRVQGDEVHLQTSGMPVDCYYLIIADLLDEAD